MELFKFDNPQLNIIGKWLLDNSAHWQGSIDYDEALFSISFLQFGDCVNWTKSANKKTNEHLIRIGLYNHKNSNEVQFSFNLNNSFGRVSTIPNKPNDKLIIHDRCDIGKISLIAEMKGTPNLKLYGLFIPRSLVKVGRNGLWNLKNETLEKVPTDFKNILRFGRTGEFTLPNENSSL